MNPESLNRTVVIAALALLLAGPAWAANTASGDHAIVGGGDGNKATGAYTIIGGGRSNTTSGTMANINGGRNNVAGAKNSTIAGGFDNRSVGVGTYIGGGGWNLASNQYSTVAGGANNVASGTNTMVGGGDSNIASGDYAVVGGGNGNTGSGWSAMVGGGYQNDATNAFDTVAGGSWNIAGGGYSTVGGGQGNTATAFCGTAGGGLGNNASGAYAFIGGGANNLATGGSSTVAGGGVNQATNTWATVAGGNKNTAGGQYSFAAGRWAQAIHDGAFVWADSLNTPFASTTANQFNVRANGGVRFDTGLAAGITLNAADRPLITRGWDVFTSGNYAGVGRWGLFMEPNALVIGMPVLGGRTVQVAKYGADGSLNTLLTVDQAGNLYTAGSINPPSGRAFKTDFTAVDVRAVLQQLVTVPIQTWVYKADEAAARHIGPVAQDFQAAFHVGTDDQHIATVDADGVALAAIQGLYQEMKDEGGRLKDEVGLLKRALEEKEHEIAELKAKQARVEGLEKQNATFEARLKALEAAQHQPSER